VSIFRPYLYGHLRNCCCSFGYMDVVVLIYFYVSYPQPDVFLSVPRPFPDV
ncbi:unnamed protein product, partial [Rotaria socialis]